MGHKSCLYLLPQVVLTQFLLFADVSAVFCDWFVCHPTEQYCCGNNVCCNYFNYNTLYLWGGAVMVGLLLVVFYYVFCSPSCRSNPESDELPIINGGERS